MSKSKHRSRAMTATNFSVKRAVATIVGAFLVAGVCLAVSNPAVVASVAPALRGRSLEQVHALGHWSHVAMVKAAKEGKLSISPPSILEESIIDGKVHRKLMDGSEMVCGGVSEDVEMNIICPWVATVYKTGILTTCECGDSSCAYQTDINDALRKTGVSEGMVPLFDTGMMSIDLKGLMTTHVTTSGLINPGTNEELVDEFLATFEGDMLTAADFEGSSLLEMGLMKGGVGATESMTMLLLPVFGHGSTYHALGGQWSRTFLPFLAGMIPGIGPALDVVGTPYGDESGELYITKAEFKGLFVHHVLPEGFIIRPPMA